MNMVGRRASRASPASGALFRVSQALVTAALDGVSDTDLVVVLGTTLTAAGLDIATIEVACDVVDPERAQHVMRWRRSVGSTDGNILAAGIFQLMLEEGWTVLRSPSPPTQWGEREGPRPPAWEGEVGAGGERVGQGETEAGSNAHLTLPSLARWAPPSPPADAGGEGPTPSRLNARNNLFAPVLRGGAMDAVAFANHLAPDATLGFFDDVMSLFSTERPGGFTAAEIDLLRLVTPVFALALGARLNAAAARGLLQTYLGRNAATALLDGRVGLGAVEQLRAVVLYCDLVEFTSLTERLDARALIDHLNLFFETMTRPVSRAGGQVSGHVGDAVVMFFPIADAQRVGPLCTVAVKAALEGLRALEALNAVPDRRSRPPLRARIGIDIGDVVHGNIGSAGRFSFTIIGTPVNRAARLQALAKDVGAAMLMTADLAQAAGIPCRAFGKHALRGFDRPVDIVGSGVCDSCDA